MADQSARLLSPTPPAPRSIPSARVPHPFGPFGILRTPSARVPARARTCLQAEYGGVTYEAVLYNVTEKSDAQGWDTDAWFGPKKELALSNPLLNLPYVVDGDKLVTQSNACIVYLGDKVNWHARDTHARAARLTALQQMTRRWRMIHIRG